MHVIFMLKYVYIAYVSIKPQSIISNAQIKRIADSLPVA